MQGFCDLHDEVYDDFDDVQAICGHVPTSIWMLASFNNNLLNTISLFHFVVCWFPKNTKQSSKSFHSLWCDRNQMYCVDNSLN